jgi:hypothetical protein
MIAQDIDVPAADTARPSMSGVTLTSLPSVLMVTRGKGWLQSSLVTPPSAARAFVAGDQVTAAVEGGSLGNTVHYRAFAKFFSRPNLQDATGSTPVGGWDSLRQGGRLDWAPTKQDRISVTGEWSLSNLREMDDEITSLTPPFESRVGEHDKTTASFLVTRWNPSTTPCS